MRYAHSVKSEASFLGYERVAELAHSLEDALSGPSLVTAEMLLRTLSALEDAFNRALEQLEEARADLNAVGGTDTEAAEDILSRMLTPRHREQIAEARERGERLFLLECELTEHPQMLSPRRYLLVGNLEQAVNLVVSYPEIKSEEPTSRFVALFTFDGDRSVPERAVDIDQVRLIRLEESDFDAILRRNDDRLAYGMIAGRRTVQVSISTRSYEELCLYAGELRRQLERLHKYLARGESRDSPVAIMLHTATRLAESVDDTISSTSTTPLSEVFQHAERYARDMAGFLDKSVRVITGGGAHRVYLPVAEVLRDVLLHLVRNGIDHGVEPREERKGLGKDAVATVRVSSRIEGEELVIRVSDDGRGIRLEDVAPGGGATGAEDIWEIVSRPGVSTRPEADRVSGRGVGLDVVRTQVERFLSGRVELETEPGTGTTITIRLPRASQLVSILIARHGHTEFALPSAHVFALLDLEARFSSRDHSGNLFYRYQGEAIRVYAVEKSAIPATVEGLRGILLRIGRRRAIVLADEVISQETVIRNTAQPETVFSQTMNRDVSLVFPVQFL
jgi:two-component system chemotaxis sensor kinase CheA